jgi:hypothetical protein
LAGGELGHAAGGQVSGVAAGRLGSSEVRGDQVLLGKPFVFNRSNIDGFDF